jgi:hypothetical protein
MIAVTCRRCGSANLQKNGRTKTGQQKFHCNDYSNSGLSMGCERLSTGHGQNHVREFPTDPLARAAW